VSRDPDLTNLVIKCDHDHDWLQAFHGAALGKLEAITFHSEQTGDFLKVFERAALTASV